MGWKNPATGLRLLRLRTPITTLFLLLSIELAVLLLYGAEGDFGPLLVLVPALLFTVVYWVITPERGAAQAGSRRLLERLVILTVLISATIGLAMAGYVLVTSETVQNLPFIGTSIHRAADRMITFTDDWYTSSGSWSVTANWIAAGLTNERYLSNLHSDLALIAFRQSFGVRSTYVIVFFYLGIALLLGFLAASFHHSHATLLSDANDADAVATRKSALVASLTLWFATFYLLMEVVVHGLTNFNFIPQTGLVLPWVSSGGSAAIAFSGLLGLVLAMAAQVYKRIAARERGRRHA
jgi:cell division protein FtsW (lipid II flippase)